MHHFFLNRTLTTRRLPWKWSRPASRRLSLQVGIGNTCSLGFWPQGGAIYSLFHTATGNILPTSGESAYTHKQFIKDLCRLCTVASPSSFCDLSQNNTPVRSVWPLWRGLLWGDVNKDRRQLCSSLFLIILEDFVQSLEIVVSVLMVRP